MWIPWALNELMTWWILQGFFKPSRGILCPCFAFPSWGGAGSRQVWELGLHFCRLSSAQFSAERLQVILFPRYDTASNRELKMIPCCCAPSWARSWLDKSCEEAWLPWRSCLSLRPAALRVGGIFSGCSAQVSLQLLWSRFACLFCWKQHGLRYGSAAVAPAHTCQLILGKHLKSFLILALSFLKWV